MLPEQSGKMLESKAKSNIVSFISISQSFKRKVESLKRTRDQDQDQNQEPHVSEQKEEIEQELDVIGILTLEKAQLEEKIMMLEERVRELEMERERDVKMLLWMRVEMARFGEWWRWVERGWGGEIQGNEGF
ncbi:hypothetical protein BOTNAR_0413g00110 [Botryotinia narcissicola]|uniref:Uncharacterized protein n=1 Tax=Botryotinia narcissicola TaxID=278944 RepID=A0A4Z1HYU9_9HELO|nr:hypothetical protein BOTNAR_0413g00110 [Botryotinia narcissicola]